MAEAAESVVVLREGNQGMVSEEEETGRKRKYSSPIWNYFEKIEGNFALCTICKTKYQHSNNTSNLSKHLQAKHRSEWNVCEEERKVHESGKQKRKLETEQDESQPTLKTVLERRTEYPKNSTRKQKLDEAFLYMVVKDMQPPSIVEDSGFINFVGILDPRYKPPSRRTLMRSLLIKRYEEAKGTIHKELEEVQSVAITTDFWTSRNSQSYITVSCHFINELWELKSYILSTYQVKMDHTAENIASELRKITDMWGISEKVSCIITDNASNMLAASRLTGWRNLPCMAHTLNLVVQESIEKVEELATLRRKCRQIVTYFKQSIKAKDKLGEIQKQMHGDERKLIQDVVTRWNSSYYMFQRLLEEYQAVNTALCMMDKSDLCLSTLETTSMKEVITLLQPFEEVTRELSADRYVSISKIIPIARGLQRITKDFLCTHPLKQELLTSMGKRYSNIEENYMLAVSTLLDPRFIKLAFGNTSSCNQAVQRMTTELTATLQQTEHNTQVQSSSEPRDNQSCPVNIWSIIDERVAASTSIRPSSSNSISMLRSYFEEANIIRNENPLVWWRKRQDISPFLCDLAKKFLSVPGTSVSSERVFSKAGELISQRRSAIKPKHVDMILFLNKNFK